MGVASADEPGVGEPVAVVETVGDAGTSRHVGEQGHRLVGQLEICFEKSDIVKAKAYFW